jgi:hypothetical protein
MMNLPKVDEKAMVPNPVLWAGRYAWKRLTEKEISFISSKKNLAMLRSATLPS